MLPCSNRFSLSLLASLLALLLLAAPRAATAQTDTTRRVTLRFDWPVGTRVRVDARHWRLTQSGDRADTSSHALSVVVSTKAHPEGRSVVLDLSQAVAEYERPVPYGVASFDDPATTVAPAMVVNGDGEVLRWEDAEPFLASIRQYTASLLDTSEVARSSFGPLLARMSRPELFTGSLEEIWRTAVGFWAGATLEVGSAYELAEPMAWPFDPMVEVPARFEFGIVSAEPCDGDTLRTCAEIVRTWRPVEDSARALASRVFARVLPPDVPDPRWEELDVEEHVALVTDVSTLVPRTMVQTTRANITVAGHPDSVVRARLLRHTEYDFTQEGERLPLHRAAAAGDRRAVRALLAEGADPDPVHFDLETPLFAAAAVGHEPIVRDLAAAGASADHAYDVARSRGMLAPMRALRPHLEHRQPALPLDSGITLFRSGNLRSVVPLFAELAVRESRPGAAHAWLAETLRRLGQAERAVATARAVIAGGTCDPLAHLVLAQALDPAVRAWPQANADSAGRHLDRAVACDADDGNAWRLIAARAAREGDTAREARAMREMASTGFLTAAALAYGRWALELLPGNAVIIASDVEHLALRGAQLVGGARPDVIVVEFENLAHDEYLRRLSARANLPVPESASEVAGSGTASPASRGVRILGGWIDDRLQGRLARPLVIGTLSAQSVEWRPGMVGGPGPYMQVRPDVSDWPAPSQVVALYREAPLAATSGPVTSPDDRFSAELRSPLSLVVVVGAIAYLHSSAELDPLDREELRALDSLAVWIETSAAALDANGAEYVRQQLGRLHLGLSYHWSQVNDLESARRHLRLATRHSPLDRDGWNAHGYLSLVLGDFETARSSLERAEAIGPALAQELNIATAFRFLGQLDSALTWLRTAERLAVGERLSDQSYMWDAWELRHLPLAPGDTLSRRLTASIEGAEEKVSLVHYNASIVHAMLGDFEAADRAFARARAQGGATGTRCFVAASMASAEGFARLSERARTWLRERRSTLRDGVHCPVPR